MKYTLTTLNIRNLLNGGAVMGIGHKKMLKLDDNFNGKDDLQKYLDDADMRKHYKIVYDTAEGGVLTIEPKEDTE